MVERERGHSAGHEVTLDALFGGRFVQRRLGLGHNGAVAHEVPPAERAAQGPRNAVVDYHLSLSAAWSWGRKSAQLGLVTG